MDGKPRVLPRAIMGKLPQQNPTSTRRSITEVRSTTPMLLSKEGGGVKGTPILRPQQPATHIEARSQPARRVGASPMSTGRLPEGWQRLEQDQEEAFLLQYSHEN